MEKKIGVPPWNSQYLTSEEHRNMKCVKNLLSLKAEVLDDLFKVRAHCIYN